MHLPLVIPHRQVLSCSFAEIQIHWEFQYTNCCTWEILISSVRWNVDHSHSIFLPFTAKDKELGGGIELKVCDASGKIHDCLDGLLSILEGAIVDVIDIN
jgi:hypothetical protein